MKKFVHKKSLGQNFLQNAAVVRAIVDYAAVTSSDVVLEVGPGDGVLTTALAARAGHVIAIEKDKRLLEVLRKRFADSAHVILVHDDLLQSNVTQIIDRATASQGSAYKAVANIPYYITAPILRLFMELDRPPQVMVVMVQKEVAERLCAAPGQMSVLSVAAQYYCDVRYMQTVDRTDFEPVPAVDSAVVMLTRRVHVRPDADFFRIVRIGFSARRKTLANNLANGLHVSKQSAIQILVQCGIAPDARAQELSVAQWRDVARVATMLGREV